MNANDAAATAKHTDLTAAKILFAQTAKGQDVLTDNDKALVERLRQYPCEYCDSDTTTAADRIEAQAAEIERLKRDHASAVAELNKTKALLKGYRRGFKNARKGATE